MNQQKCFYSIVSSKNFKNTRQQWLKNTWLKNLDYVFLSDINNEDNIKLSNNSDYSSGEEKVLNSYEYLWKEKNEYDWFIFCDDDTFLNIKNLENYIATTGFSNFGHLFTKENQPQNQIWQKEGNDFKYYSGGAGYVFDKETLKKIHHLTLKIKSGWGDVATGHLLKKANINLNHCDKMNWHNPYVFAHNEQTIKQAISYHYVQSEEMMINLYIKTK